MGKTYLITGATRGIGFEFVRQLSEIADNKVIASARDVQNAGKLQELADLRQNVLIVELEVGDGESAAKLSEQLMKITSGIDILIHNAGIAFPETANATLQIGRNTWLDHYKVNTLGAIEVFQKVYPFLMKNDTRKVAFLSSAAGSFSEFLPMPVGAYAQSKAALNYTIKHMAFEVQNEGMTVLALHPGLVTTDMGNQAVDIYQEVVPGPALEEMKLGAVTPEESVNGLLKVIEEAEIEKSGKFLYHDGTVHEF